MRKSWLTITGVLIFSGVLVAAAGAASSVKVVLNDKEIKPDASIRTVKGQTMVSLRWLAGTLGSEVSWDKNTRTIVITQTENQKLQAKAHRMEEALKEIVAPKTAEEAVNIWAEGLKERNAAMQYAVMTPELCKQNLSTYDEMYWTTGGSSPWVERYQITNKTLKPDGSCAIEIELLMKTSGEEGIDIARLLVSHLRDQKGGEEWLISNITFTSRTEIPEFGLCLELPEGWNIWHKTTENQEYWISGNWFSVPGGQRQLTGRIEQLGGYYLPNHSQTLSEKRLLTGLGEGHLAVLECSQPAASGNQETWKEVHLFVPLDSHSWLDFSLKPASGEDIGKLQAELEKVAASIEKKTSALMP